MPAEAALEAEILALLAERPVHSSICPSEAARRVAADGEWQALMNPAREAARRLAARGLVEMIQHGLRVDPSRARGPVRLRRRDGPLENSAETDGQLGHTSRAPTTLERRLQTSHRP